MKIFNAAANKIIRRIQRTVIRIMQIIRIIYYRLISDLNFQGQPRRNQPLLAVGKGTLNCVGIVNIGVFPSPGFISTHAYIEARNPGTFINIGDGTWINNGFVAIAEHTHILIGQNCKIGHNCEILDSDFHGLEVSNRSQSDPSWAKPVVIEDDVFIGGNVKILKGVRVGRGSVLANGSIVTKDIPPLTIAGGNPARAIRQIPD